MIDDLRPYSRYDDSRLPWLEEIPSHWDVRRNGRLFVQRNETGFPELPILEVSLKTGVRVRDMENLARKQVMSDKEKYKRAKQGDIAYNMMRMWQGAVGVAPVDGLVSPAYVVAKHLPAVDSRYYQYLFRTGAYMNEVNKFTRCIVSDRNRLYWEDFKQMPSPFPPPEEQAGIVRFLDYVDRRVRRYIRAKRRLITLLEEQKQALIHRAVTRGLDPNVPLKPSGIEWLGDVPEHWDLSRVKNEFVCLNNRRIPLSSPERGRMKIRQYDYYGASGVIDKVDDYIFDDELLLIAEDGANLKLRNLPLAIIARGRFWVNNHAHILKPRVGNLEFLAHLMETLNYLPWISGAAQPKLTKDRLLSIEIVVPRPEDQNKIVQHIGNETCSIATTIGQTKREIALVREYRTRLIADVVTGKLDVRAAAARLPVEIDAPEAGDDELLNGENGARDMDVTADPEEVEA